MILNELETRALSEQRRAAGIPMGNLTAGVTVDPADLLELIARVRKLEAQLEPSHHETPAGHLDAWADTGDGYTQHHGWQLKCIWCGCTFEGKTKREALTLYGQHAEKMIELAAEAS